MILVLFVLAWRLGWLANVPVIGDLLGGKKVANILVVGQDADIARLLDEVRPGISVNYEILDQAGIDSVRDPAFLKKYDIIILTENAGADRTMLPAIFRNYLSQYLAGSGKMILIGVAGSRDPADPSINGWIQSGMDAYIPVTCKTGLCDATNSVDFSAFDQVTMKVRNINHQVLKEFGNVVTLTSGQTVEYAIVNAKVEPLAVLEINAGSTVLSFPALVEESFGLGGKTVYFAYHPSRTPTLFKNVITYLRG